MPILKTRGRHSLCRPKTLKLISSINITGEVRQHLGIYGPSFYDQLGSGTNTNWESDCYKLVRAYFMLVNRETKLGGCFEVNFEFERCIGNLNRNIDP